MYLQFWTAFLEEWTDLEKDGAAMSPPSEHKAEPAPAEMMAESPDTNPTLAEKYRYLSEYGTQILFLFNASEGCTYISPNFTVITGHDCADCLGEQFFPLVQEDSRLPLQAVLSAVVSGVPQSFRFKLRHADQKGYWYSFDLHPQEAGKYVCIAENIHKTMQTQNTLQKARLEAELALRSRSEFLSNMSHELRTPLNAVIGFSQIIESEIFGKVGNPQYLEYVKHIQESGYDLLVRIEDLLEIANIEAGRVQLTRVEVYASEIVQKVLEGQAHHASAAKVTLQYTPPADDILLSADRLKLQHILGHLIANAIRFSHEGGVVSISAIRSDQGELELCVSDTGTGMTEVKRAAIMKILAEDNCWTANHDRAIGLGLALTREFVALHGGRVAIDSKPGEGARLRITLPKACVRPVVAEKFGYLQVVG